jgi:hypothetical protein
LLVLQVRLLRLSFCGLRDVTYSGTIDPWPWFDEVPETRYADDNSWRRVKVWDKREKHDRMRRLEIAGALIAAEIDRLEAGGKS